VGSALRRSSVLLLETEKHQIINPIKKISILHYRKFLHIYTTQLKHSERILKNFSHLDMNKYKVTLKVKLLLSVFLPCKKKPSNLT